MPLKLEHMSYESTMFQMWSTWEPLRNLSTGQQSWHNLFVKRYVIHKF